MTTSSSALADAMKGEELTPGGEGGQGDGRHEEVSLVIALSMVEVPLTDEVILTNGAGLER